MAPPSVSQRAPVVPSLSDAKRKIYSIGNGRWYISFCVTTGSYQMTSGDYWFAITAAEGRNWIEHPELAP
jgi:hypothetical protein